jgi:hypothetical protein
MAGEEGLIPCSGHCIWQKAFAKKSSSNFLREATILSLPRT